MVIFSIAIDRVHAAAAVGEGGADAGNVVAALAGYLPHAGQTGFAAFGGGFAFI